MKLTREKVITAIVLGSLFFAGASTLSTGKFYLNQSSGPTINLEGPAAYILGLVFIGLGLFVAHRVFRR